jgi:hypothetical protein
MSHSPHSYETAGPLPSFRLLFRLGAFAAAATVAVTVIQIALGILWPPPDFAPTAAATTAILEMAQADPLLTFLKLDGLMILDYVLLVVVFLALCAALYRQNPSLILLGTALALIAITLYFATNPAATILVLAQHYDASAAAGPNTGVVAAGQASLIDFQGTAFLLHYVMMGVAGMMVSTVMFRSAIFSRTTAIAGVLQGAMMLVPVTFGTVGLFFAVGSLVPFTVWFVLISRTLRQMSARPGQG